MSADYAPAPRGRKAGLPPAAVLALGFFLIIAVGTALLLLPAATKEGRSPGLLVALFTATSATCVTGLTLVDTFSAFSLFGQLIILSLIQVGGLGFMLFGTMMLVAFGRRVSLHNRMLLRESMSLKGLSGGVRTAKRFFALAFGMEALGALLLSIRFVPQFGWGRGLYFGAFHAISAFCNAGFDLFGASGSLSAYRGDALVLVTISLLIVLGGLGFAVIWDVVDHASKPRAMSLHSKIVLATSGALLLGGFLFFAAAEWQNGQTLAREGAGSGERLLNAWFQTVTSRTAGFFSFPQAQMGDAGKLFSTILMFIGASPASTGGGVKTSTLFVVLAVLYSVSRGQEDINAFGRRLGGGIGRSAQSILFVYLALLTGGVLLLSLFEQGRGFAFLDLLFEEASALGTVGLTTTGTSGLTVSSKFLLVMLMYFGRVGPLTIMLSLNRHAARSGGSIRYPEEQIIVG